MGRKPKLSNLQMKFVFDAVECMPRKEIAREVSVSGAALTKFLDKNGIAPAKKHKKHPPKPKKDDYDLMKWFAKEVKKIPWKEALHSSNREQFKYEFRRYKEQLHRPER